MNFVLGWLQLPWIQAAHAKSTQFLFQHPIKFDAFLSNEEALERSTASYIFQIQSRFSLPCPIESSRDNPTNLAGQNEPISFQLNAELVTFLLKITTYHLC